MKNKNKVIAVIEIGSSKISTLIAQVATDEITLEKNLNIVGVSSVNSKGIKKGQIVNIEEAVDATIESVEASERMAGYNVESAYLSIGGAHVHSQNSHGVVAVSDPNGEINQSDVDRAIEAASAISIPASREIIHVLPREYVVDGEGGVRDPIGMSGVRLEVDAHIISAGSAALKNIKKALSEVGVRIEGIVFSGLASSYSVLTPTEKELGCVLIDIGGGTTSIAAYVDGSLSYSGVVPIGAKNVTNDLAIGLRVSLDTAEKIKIALSKKTKKEDSDEIDLGAMGVTEIRKISKKTLVEGIIRPRLNEIFTMVRLELEKEGLSNRIPSGAIITGGGADTVGLTDCARRMLALPVRVGVPSGVSGLVDDILNPAFATTIGLMVYGSNTSKTENSNPLGKKLKLPQVGNGIIGKIFNTVKDLLP